MKMLCLDPNPVQVAHTENFVRLLQKIAPGLQSAGQSKDGERGFKDNEEGLGCAKGTGLTVTMIVLYRVIDLVVTRTLDVRGRNPTLVVAYERILESEWFEGVSLVPSGWWLEGGCCIDGE